MNFTNCRPFKPGRRIAPSFTLIELLVVVSIIAVLIALLLPAIENARSAARIAVCASRQRQLLVALQVYGAEHNGLLPPGSGYSSQTTCPHRALRGSGDFFDVLVREYVTSPEVWYCPGGLFFPETSWDIGGGHVYGIINVYSNLWEKGGYTDIPRRLQDPPDWVLTNDGTYINSLTEEWGQGNHPGFAPGHRLTPPMFGRDHPGAPFGVNTGLLGGAVVWTPQRECDYGYPGGGGGMQHTIVRLLEPPKY